MKVRYTVLAVTAWLLLAVSVTLAQPPSAFLQGQAHGPASQTDAAGLKDIGIDQHLDTQIPLGL